MLETKLMQLKLRFTEVTTKLNSGILPPDELADLGRMVAKLEPLVQKISLWEKYRDGIKDIEEMLVDSSLDTEMRRMAEEEKYLLLKQKEEITQEIRIALLPKDEADERNIILEIRAGTGGEEAALFAGDLFKMYHRYAENLGWKTELMHSSETGIGGYKEIIANIRGQSVFANLKYESGVHRVQRIPQTESGGRVHTSAATVAILPEAEEVDVQIKDGELRVDTYRAQGAGGQHVNTTDSAVRITHLPSGIVVQCQDEKSQHKNRDKAMKMLKTRLYDYERQQKLSERAQDRKAQVGSGDRSERIRTYNFPQGRVTDHRIGLTLYKLDKILAGDELDELIKALIAEAQLKLLGSEHDDHSLLA